MARPGRKPQVLDLNQLATAITEAVTGEPAGPPALEDAGPAAPELRTLLEKLPRRGRKVFRFTTKRGKPLLAGGVSQRITALARKAGVSATPYGTSINSPSANGTPTR